MSEEQASTPVTCSAVITAGGPSPSLLRGLVPAWPDAAACGPAFTVRGVAGDNLALHRALAAAPERSILVADVGGDTAHGHWGDLMTVAAQQRRLAGLVIRGSIRDRSAIIRAGFPVFHRGLSPRPAAKREPGSLNCDLDWDGTLVCDGDFIVADADGVAVVPASEVTKVLEAAEELERREEAVRRALLAGTTTLEALGLDAIV